TKPAILLPVREGSGFNVQGSAFNVQRSGFNVQGSTQIPLLKVLLYLLPQTIIKYYRQRVK
ncbi:MAG: hypothetical protein ACLFVQ_14115, partial [Chitinispirillaceae bacterium]